MTRFVVTVLVSACMAGQALAATKTAEPSFFELKLPPSGPGEGIVQLEPKPDDSAQQEREELFRKLLDGSPGLEQAVPDGLPPVPASLPPVQPSVDGQQPGVPMQVFTSLQAAAEAGIDPLAEEEGRREDVAQTSAQASGQVSTVQSAHADGKSPETYLALVMQYQSELVQAVLGVVAGMLVLWLVRRRRR